MTQDVTSQDFERAGDRVAEPGETDRLRAEVADARHHLLTVQDHVVGLEAENGRLNRDLTRVTTELRQVRRRINKLATQRDDLQQRLQEIRSRLEASRARVAELDAAGSRPSVARRLVRRVRGALG